MRSPRIDIDKLLDYVGASMRQPKPIRPPKVKKPSPFRMKKTSPTVRVYPDRVMQALVRYYYGNGFDQKPTVSLRKVAVIFNIPFPTVNDAIKKFK